MARLHNTAKEANLFMERAMKEREAVPIEGRIAFLERLVERVKSMLFVSATGGQAHFFSSV